MSKRNRYSCRPCIDVAACVSYSRFLIFYSSDDRVRFIFIGAIIRGHLEARYNRTYREEHALQIHIHRRVNSSDDITRYLYFKPFRE